MIRWYKGTDPIEPDESKQILFYAGGCSLPYLGFYYKSKDMFGDWKTDEVQKWRYMEDILDLANQVPEKKYTFSVFSEGIHATDKSGIVYPKKTNCCCNELEIEFTDKIEEAITWPEREMVETIANEYYNSEIIEINEDYTSNLEFGLECYYMLMEEARNILLEFATLDKYSQTGDFNEIMEKAQKFIDKTEDTLVKKEQQ